MAVVTALMVLTGWMAEPKRATAQSDAFSIVEFEAAKDKWSQRLRLPMRLEGRYTVLSANDIKFAGCDMRFLLPKLFVRPRGDFRNVEVSGQLEKRDGEIVFLVRSLKTRPSDRETLDRKRATIDTSEPEEFYELGQWARDRGKFYEDDDLIKAANGLFEAGLARAFDLLDKEDADGMRDLAMQVTKFRLSDRLRLQYLHEANRTQFEMEQQRSPPQFASLLKHITQELPGSSEPLPPEKEPLRNDYSKAPRLAYRVSDSPTRRLFDRIFYSEVVLARIEQTANSDGSNGGEIAAKIEKQLPELRDVAESYRDRELDHLSGRAEELGREQLLELSSRFEARGQTDRAAEIKRRWLAAREQHLTADGPRRLSELMDLGEDYLNLLQDERGAARLFRKAYQANPQLTMAADWLSGHGYELRDGRWSRPGEAETDEQSELADAIHEGRVLEGMTGTQVRSTLGGAPSSIVRIASAGQISEIWLYEELRVSVQLTRRSHQKELNVRRVTDAP